MRVLLNIGLDNVPVVGQSFTNGVRNPITVERLFAARRALRDAGFEVYQAKLVQSDTEPTLVASALYMGHLVQLEEKVHALSAALNQDCIAVHCPRNGQGWLFGPKAEAWGPFNPEFFFLLDGTRLHASP